MLPIILFGNYSQLEGHPMKLNSIREQRAHKVAAMRAMLAKAETEKRSLNAEEKTAFDALKAEVADLEQQEQRVLFLEEVERRSGGQPIPQAGMTDLENRVSLVEVIRAQTEGRQLDGAAAEYHREAERRTGRKAKGIYVPLSLFERRASTTSTAAELVPTIHRADQYISPLRNALLTRRMGVRVLSGLTGNIEIPKHGSSMTVGWVGEDSDLSSSDMSFDQVDLSPKHAGGFTRLSRQLIQQSSPDVEQLVRDDFTALIAQTIDTAIITGAGGTEPTGVLNASDTQSQDLATLDWSGILTMVEKLELQNAQSGNTNWLSSPGVKKMLGGTLKEAGIAGYLLEGGMMAEFPLFSTNQVPFHEGSPQQGQLILGDWTQVLLGIWSEIDILVNPYETEAFKKGAVLVRAMSTIDVGIRHPQAFVIGKNIVVS
jgi:HK97 family phage major capsid protein